MSQEQIQSQLAELQRANAELSHEVAELKKERDRILEAIQCWIPFPTEAELMELASNPVQLTDVIDELAKEY